MNCAALKKLYKIRLLKNTRVKIFTSERGNTRNDDEVILKLAEHVIANQQSSEGMLWCLPLIISIEIDQISLVQSNYKPQDMVNLIN